MNQYDQTQFNTQGPADEQSVQMPTTSPERLSKLSPTLPKSKKPLVIFGSVSVSLLLLVMLSIWLLRGNAIGEVDREWPMFGQTELEPSALTEQVVNLETELEAADPSKDRQPFPPVDMYINLEEPTIDTEF